MARFLFFLKQSAIYCRITLKGERAEISTGIKVDESKWDTERKRVKGATDGPQSINRRLEETLSKLRNIETTLQQQGLPYGAKTIKDTYEGKGVSEKRFLEVFRQWMEQAADETSETRLKESTLETYQTRYKNVESYIKQHLKKDDLFFHQIDEDFLDGFKRYLLKDHGFKIGHVGRQIEAVKTIVKYALRKKYAKESHVQHIKPPKENYGARDIIYLTQEQLTRLEQHPFTGNLKEIIDCCIVQAHTGMAYHDLFEFRRDWIYRGTDGNQWVEYYRVKMLGKNRHKVRLPLSDKVLQIINSYGQHPRCVDGKALPVRSNQEMNRHLKSVAALFGLPGSLSTHHFRKTAGMLWLNSGVSIETVAALLGDTVQVTKAHYARVIEERIARELAGVKKSV